MFAREREKEGCKMSIKRGVLPVLIMGFGAEQAARRILNLSALLLLESGNPNHIWSKMVYCILYCFLYAALILESLGLFKPGTRKISRFFLWSAPGLYLMAGAGMLLLSPLRRGGNQTAMVAYDPGKYILQSLLPVAVLLAVSLCLALNRTLWKSKAWRWITRGVFIGLLLGYAGVMLWQYVTAPRGFLYLRLEMLGIYLPDIVREIWALLIVGAGLFLPGEEGAAGPAEPSLPGNREFVYDGGNTGAWGNPAPLPEANPDANNVIEA